jgi:protein ImuB
VSERLELEGGTESIEALALVLEELGRRILERLALCSLGARAVELVFLRDAEPEDRFEIRLAAPVSRLEALQGILRERLDHLDLGRPVHAVLLRVPETARLEQRQGDLFSSRERSADEDLACLLARLEGRLGARRVARADLVSDHRPERAYSYGPASAPVTSEEAGPPGRRPTRLLARPAPLEVFVSSLPIRFVLRGVTHDVQRALGPERIESGFWDGAEVRRDYWILSDEAWRELWVFRELDSGRWFLHGIFD